MSDRESVGRVDTAGVEPLFAGLLSTLRPRSFFSLGNGEFASFGVSRPVVASCQAELTKSRTLRAPLRRRWP